MGLRCAVLCYAVLLQARLVGSNTLTAADVVVAELPGGAVSCSYSAPAAAGMYVLEVTAGGKHVGGSPFSVKVCCLWKIAHGFDASGLPPGCLCCGCNTSCCAEQLLLTVQPVCA
jgi:hypothetical protein